MQCIYATDLRLKWGVYSTKLIVAHMHIWANRILRPRIWLGVSLAVERQALYSSRWTLESEVRLEDELCAQSEKTSRAQKTSSRRGCRNRKSESSSRLSSPPDCSHRNTGKKSAQVQRLSEVSIVAGSDGAGEQGGFVLSPVQEPEDRRSAAEPAQDRCPSLTKPAGRSDKRHRSYAEVAISGAEQLHLNEKGQSPGKPHDLDCTTSCTCRRAANFKSPRRSTNEVSDEVPNTRSIPHRSSQDSNERIRYRKAYTFWTNAPDSVRDADSSTERVHFKTEH